MAKIAAGVVTFCLATVIGVVALLSQDSLSLAPLSGYLTAQINDAIDGPETVSFESPELYWDRDNRRLRLRVRQLTVSGPETAGAPLFTSPEVDIGVSGKALFLGQFSVQSIALVAPELSINRSADGALSFGMRTAQGDTNIEANIAELFGGPEGQTLSLSPDVILSVKQAAVRFRDIASDYDRVVARASLAFTRREALLDVTGTIQVNSGDYHIPFDIAGQFHTGTPQQLGLNLQFKYVSPSDFVPLLTSLPNLFNEEPAPLAELADALGRMSSGLSGKVQLGLGLDTGIQHVSLDLKGGAGTLDAAPLLPTLPILREFAVRASYRPPIAGSGVEARIRITDFTAAFDDGVTIGGDAVVFPAYGKPGIIGDFTVRDLALDNLQNYWPAEFAVQGRQWVLENISNGTVPLANLHIDAPPERLAIQPAPADLLSFRFEFEDTTARYWSPLTKITGGAGNAEILPDRFQLFLDRGNVGDLRVRDGTLTIKGLQARDQIADISVVVDGKASDSLALIDLPPLEFATELGLDPTLVDGNASTRVSLVVPLEYDLTLDQVKVAATAQLSNIAAPKIFRQYSLSGSTLNLKADNFGMAVTGDIALNGVPMAIRWVRQFVQSADEPTSRYVISGELDDADRRKLQLDTEPFLRGPVRDVVFTFETDENTWVRGDVSADMTAAEWQLPADLGLKPAGEDSGIAFSFATKTDDDFLLQDIRLQSDAIAVAADATLRGGVLIKATVQQLSTSRHDLRADIEVAGNGLSVALSGPRLDLSDLVGFDRISGDEGPASQSPLPPETNIALTANMDALVLAKDLQLKPGRLIAEIQNSEPVAVDLSGMLNGETELRAELVTVDVPAIAPDEGKSETASVSETRKRLVIRADDAGAVFRAAGLYPNAIGGKLAATFDLPQIKGAAIHSRVTATDFRIVEAPVLTQILTLGSLTGIRDVVRGDGIAFSQLDGSFDITGDHIALKDARAIGPALGLMIKGDLDRANNNVKMSGTLVPAYSLNSVLGNIPLLGNLFVGNQGEGVFALTYRVEGPLEKPTISVNPLSALAPGFLRRIVSGLENAIRGDDSAVIETDAATSKAVTGTEKLQATDPSQ